jgi:hypothetical protein
VSLKTTTSDVDGAMNAWVRLVPIRHSRVDIDRELLTGVAILDPKLLSLRHHSEAPADVGVPGRRLLGREGQSPDQQSGFFRDELALHATLHPLLTARFYSNACRKPPPAAHRDARARARDEFPLDDHCVGNRLPADLDGKALAQFVLTTMEGGVMQARAHRSLEPFDASVSQRIGASCVHRFPTIVKTEGFS